MISAVYRAGISPLPCTNLQLVKSLGADKVIDYTKEDFTQTGQTYDIIFDVVNKSSFLRCKNFLTQKGVYLSTVPTLLVLVQMLWSSKIGSKKAIFSATGLRSVPERLIFLKELIKLIEEGKIKSVIDGLSVGTNCRCSQVCRNRTQKGKCSYHSRT